MAKVHRVGRSFSTLPFDGIDNVRNVFLHDDFITAQASTDATSASGAEYLSELKWVVSEETAVTGGGTIAPIAGEKGHPGIVRITVPADALDNVALTLGEDDADGQLGGFILDDNGVYIATIVRLNDIDGASFEFGLQGQAPTTPNSGALDLVALVLDDADTTGKFIAQVNSNNTDVEEAFTFTVPDADWVMLEIYATDTDATFRVTTEDGAEVVNLTPDAMPLVGLQPGYVVESVAGNADTVDIDAFHLRYGRPSEAANATIDWLGQSGA